MEFFEFLVRDQNPAWYVGPLLNIQSYLLLIENKFSENNLKST